MGNLTLAPIKMSNSPGSARSPPPPPWGLTLIGAQNLLSSMMSAIVQPTELASKKVQSNAHLMDARLIQTPHYYGQFAFSLGKQTLKFSLNSTSLIRTHR